MFLILIMVNIAVEKIDLNTPVRFIYFDKNVQIRILNTCKYLDIVTLKELVRLPEDTFIRCRNCGKLTTKAINDTLAMMGLRIGMTSEEINEYENSFHHQLKDVLKDKRHSIFHSIFMRVMDGYMLRSTTDEIIKKSVELTKAYEKAYLEYDRSFRDVTFSESGEVQH